MYGQRLLVIFVFLIISILAQRERKKTCIHNLVLNGTNLLTTHRKQLLVVGITDFNNQSARIQANRYNDIVRELKRQDIHDSIVQLVLINDKNAVQNYPGKKYDKVEIYQDNSRDHLIKTLRNKNASINNFVFGRCGYLIFSQDGSEADLQDGENFQDLVRVITTAVKNKRRCGGLCS